MTRQDEQISRQELAEPVQRGHPVIQRIGLGFGRPDGDVRRDSRQDLVTRDEDVIRLAPQTGVLGAVTVADQDGPVLAADRQDLALPNPLIAGRHGRHALGEHAVGLAVALDLRLVPAAGAPEDRARLWRRTGIGEQHPAGDIFQLGHQQGRVEPLAQPAGQADMVWMHMGADDPRDRLARQRPGQRRLPARDGVRCSDAGVDDGPALAVLDRIDVDVIELHRQRQAQPQHAGRRLDRLARRRRGAERIGQAAQAVAAGLYLAFARDHAVRQVSLQSQRADHRPGRIRASSARS